MARNQDNENMSHADTALFRHLFDSEDNLLVAFRGSLGGLLNVRLNFGSSA
jgi:hypothetical protein